MSYTENEIKSFIVLWLSLVVGLLIIIFVKRWLNPQVYNPTTTAVSRRRKIIKDPLIRRPLPPITCKMLPPGSKKSATFTKKAVSSNGGDDEVLVNRKNLNRVSRSSPSPNVIASSESKVPETPPPPKHIPFPQIPQDGELLFESMDFIFTSVATGLQYLNLYRTVWWLPNSYIHQTMNFYLIDPHVVAFIMVVLCRRLMLSMCVAILQSTLAPNLWTHFLVAIRMFVLGVVLGALAWCAYYILLKYPIVKIFYLCYPAIIYFLLFGFQVGPFLELSNDRPPLHCCSNDPQAIREEVDILRQDFNLRVKKILFGSVVGAYYTSFIPCCFAQPFLYYDVVGASQYTALVWGTLLARLAARLLAAAYCDVPHRAALHLGAWTAAAAPSTAAPAAPAWSSARCYGRGARVASGGALQEVSSARAAADPARASHRRFYMVFKNPSYLTCLLVCLQLSLIIVQLCLICSSIQWHMFISLTILLFINYYTAFKLVRDYLVSWKVYKAEYMIQDKNSGVMAD